MGVNNSRRAYPRMWKAFRFVWDILTKPSPQIPELIIQRKSRLLSGFLVLFIFIQLISLGLNIRRGIVYQEGPTIVLILFFSLSLYLLSRTRHFLITSIISVLFFPFTVIVVVLTGISPAPEIIMVRIVLSFFLGILFLSTSGLAYLGAFNVTVLLLLSWLAPQNFANIGFTRFIIVFCVVSAGLAIISRYFFEQAELDQTAELRQSKEHFRKLFATNPNPLFLTRVRDGQIVEVNDKVENLFGYSREELVGQTVLSVNLYGNSDDRPKLIQQLRQQGSLRDYEVEARIKSGEKINLSVSIESLEVDEEPHMIATVRDITQQKKIEEQLEYHSYILENLAEGVNYVDESGIVRYTNPAFDAMVGYEKGELLGQPVHTINDLPPEENERFVGEVFSALNAMGLWEGEVRNKKKDGTSIITWAKIQALTFGENSYWVTFQRDITKQKEAEAQIAYHAHILENLGEGLNYVDEEGIIRFTNPALDRMFGYEKGELVGKPVSILNDLEPELSEKFVAGIFGALERAGVWIGEFQNRKKDGTSFVTFGKVHQIVLGGKTFAVTFQEDITERKILEEQLRQAQKMEAIGQLTAGIAHDFNNLLTAIEVSAEMIQHELETNSRLYKRTERILDASQLAANLVSQLMIFSHKQIEKPEQLNLNVVVTDISKLLQRIIGEHIEFITNKAHDLWSIKADRSQMEQIVVNLAVNARDAMPDGGTLVIKTSNFSMDESTTKLGLLQNNPGDYIMLAVYDTGGGMSKEVQDKIFEPFFTTKGMGRGTGLGLATVYSIVDKCGGNIILESSLGKGSIFKIFLPRSANTGLETNHTLESATMPKGNETILLVEDEEGVRTPVSDILRSQGYSVVEARDAQEAYRLAMIHGDSINLLLTDVVMPHVSGKALAEALGQKSSKIKVLYMSGYTDEEISHHGVLNSGVAFLQKPFDSKTLTFKVREVLDEPLP